MKFWKAGVVPIRLVRVGLSDESITMRVRLPRYPGFLKASVYKSGPSKAWAATRPSMVRSSEREGSGCHFADRWRPGERTG